MNPLRQNYKHTKTLADLLNINHEYCIPVVIFIGDAIFKTPMPDNVVSDGGSLANYIRRHQQTRFSEAEVLSMTDTIKNNCLMQNRATKQAHINHIKTLHTQAQKQPTPSCPHCGSNMKLRTAHKGAHSGKQFWGCEHFPKCHGTKAYIQGR
ncbi:topoisomerase DNA-binding C4 zinc finger domain-containing protein [Cardiobacteriaceae bacterium TAE3-ERU3]|nr:topoisomerase DNA-binding C4 zinc finger domain-containing protein [Cardiobacteriaceae bacterium TAE3-ERU3]